MEKLKYEQSVEQLADKTLTKKEFAISLRLLRAVESRKEYIDGKLKLNFEHVFSTGEVLEAQEDENGIARIVLKKSNETILDFSQTLSQEYKFVTPSYFKKNKSLGYRPGEWMAQQTEKWISIGDMKDARSLFVLLHEVGHTHKPLSQNQVRATEIYESARSSGGPVKFKKQFIKKITQDISSDERDAWAGAVRIAREIRKRYGVNIFEVFKDSAEFQQFIYGALIDHRFGKESALVLSDKSKLQYVWESLKKNLFGVERDSKERKFMEGLFDKSRLRRKSIGDLKEKWVQEENESKEQGIEQGPTSG